MSETTDNTALDTSPLPLDVPLAPEMNVYAFYKGIADDVTELQHEILEHLVAAGTKRGWFPDLEQVVQRFTEHEPEPKVRAALAGLQRLRLLYLSDGADGKIESIVGGITHTPTPFRAMTDENVPFHLLSALDALTIAPTLQRPTTIHSRCGVSDAPIEIRLGRDGSIEASTPASVTAFIPGWDGTESIPALGARSHFFSSDAELEQWQLREGEPDGMPLTQDTIRLVGTEMAGAIAALYVKMSVR